MPDWKKAAAVESVILVWQENPGDPSYVVMLPFDGATGWLCIKVDDYGSHQIGLFWTSMFGAMDAAARDAGVEGSAPRQTWDIPDGWEMVSTLCGPTMQRTDAVSVTRRAMSPTPWRRVVEFIKSTQDGHLGARR